MCHRCALDEMDTLKTDQKEQCDGEGEPTENGPREPFEEWGATVAIEELPSLPKVERKACLKDRNKPKMNNEEYRYDEERNTEKNKRRSKSVPRKWRIERKQVIFHESLGKQAENDSELVGVRE